MLLNLIISVGLLVSQPPQFWSAIANSTECDAGTRYAAIVNLVNMHARPGMSVTAFIHLLDNPNWLKKTDLINWNMVGGSYYIPLELDEDSTPFSIQIPGHGAAIYFRVAGQMDVDTLWKLAHEERMVDFADSTVLEITTSVGEDLCRQRLNPIRAKRRALVGRVVKGMTRAKSVR
jgi:hypothetical protein